MAFAYVNPLSALWQRRGLSSLLMPQGFDAFAAPQPESVARPPVRGAAGGTATAYAGRQGARPEASGQAGQTGPAGQTGQAGQAARPPHRAAQPSQGAARTAPSGIAPRTEATAPETASDSRLWKPLPPHVWPAPWRQQLEKTRPGLILWTYWNLGLDLSDPQAEGRLERRGFLQKLLQDLAHPAGTHTFWPAGLPAAPEDRTPDQEDALMPHADAFWSGASGLGARGVVVMGSAAVKALGLPPGLRPLQQTRYKGHMVWVLWDVDYMQREDQRYASMLAFLRQALRQVAR
ncbi:MAG: hypothetical protein QM579_01020 [Desulfovibrio sp.]|uniref:hypothetical protein n=1 Tax=Desulfovibrio sp. TaxID=885 RepID=UPI0039E68128